MAKKKASSPEDDPRVVEIVRLLDALEGDLSVSRAGTLALLEAVDDHLSAQITSLTDEAPDDDVEG